MTFETISGQLRRHPWLWGMLLFQAAAFLVFANTFDNAWTYDDGPVIVENPDILSFGNFLKDRYAGRPLRELTYLLDHALFGLQPAGWHLQQIFWHGLNAFLVFALLRRLAQPLFLSFLAGGLFLAHPLTVEVVANISHRKDSLALAFILLAVHAWLAALRAPRRRWEWLAATAACWGVALLAKENAIVLPAMLLLLEWTVVPQEQRWLLRGRFALPAWVAAALAAGVAGFLLNGGWAAYARSGQFILSKLNIYEFTPGLYLLVLLKSWAFMLWRIVWPADLAVEYTFRVPDGLFDPWVLAILLLAVAGALLAAYTLRRAPLYAFAIGWGVLLFLPVANLWPGIYFAADRYLYAPLAGAAILAALLLDRLCHRVRPAGVAAAVVLVLLLALLTWRQNDIWQDDAALWHQAVAVSPDSVYALNNLGVVYARQKNWDKAIELLTRAAVNPFYREAQLNLARLHAWLGNAEEARRYQERADNPHAGLR